MPASRREFLGAAFSAGAVATVGITGRARAGARSVFEVVADDEELKEGLAVGGLKGIPEASSKMKILILGGTGFLGPHVVQYAQARGHAVSIFHRGKTNPHLFPGVEKLIGNRDPKIDEGLTALEGREWDAVVDTSSYFPRVTRASCELLRDRVGFYALISSISVYASFDADAITEDAPVGTIEDESIEKVDNFTYGPLKALCEQAAEEAMPGRVANIRPGLIVGPRDNSDRFTYWPARIERGGEVLAPGNPNDPAQWIDARDLAAFIIKCCEDKAAGVYNAVGPAAPSNIAELLYGCKAVTGADATFTWVPADFLTEHGVGAWMQMPVWVPPDGESRGIMKANIDRALAAGMTFRPLADTVEDTLEWWHSMPEDRREKMRAGVTVAKEKAVLDAWHGEMAAAKSKEKAAAETSGG